MAKELVWYEVKDLTSYGLKYPKDWYKRNGHNMKSWDDSVCETLGQYSSEEKAIDCLKKWANEKGLNPEDLDRTTFGIEYYENDFSITCMPIAEFGVWYDIYDEVTTDKLERCYGTGAMIVKKIITLDED